VFLRRRHKTLRGRRTVRLQGEAEDSSSPKGGDGVRAESDTTGNEAAAPQIRLVSQDGAAISDSGKTADAFTEFTSQPLDQGCIVNEKYRLEKIIGHGSMGVVWRARDLGFDRSQVGKPYVAIKFFNDDFTRDPKTVKALQDQVSKASKLAHPNIANVISFERHGTEYCMVMEYLNGESLATFIERDALLGLTKVQRRKIIDEIVEGLARGLAYAHDCGVVHSDIKPSTVFLTRTGQVKIRNFCNAHTVFGLIDAAGDEPLAEAAELDRPIPVYASRDLLDQDKTDVRNDVYAFACVVYELFTGEHPFGGISAVEARAARLRPGRVKGLNRRENKALLSGLALSLEQRTPTIKQFMMDLRPPETSRFVPASKFFLAAILVLLLAVLASIWLPDRPGTIDQPGIIDAPTAAETELTTGDKVTPAETIASQMELQTELVDQQVQQDIDLAAPATNDDAGSVSPEQVQIAPLPEATNPDVRQDTGLSGTTIEAQPIDESRPPPNQLRAEQQAAAELQVRALVANPAFNAAWDQQLSRQFKIIAGAEANRDQTARLAADIAGIYINESRRLRVEERRLAVAQDLLTKAADFDPAAPGLLLEQTALKAAIAAQRAEEQNRSSEPSEVSEPLDDITRLKQNFAAQTEGRDIVAANKTLTELRDKLPADDPYIAREAPEMLAEAYLSLAQSAAKGGRYTTAEALTNQANKLKAASQQAQK
jgi:serine/threonine protein kinase